MWCSTDARFAQLWRVKTSAVQQQCHNAMGTDTNASGEQPRAVSQGSWKHTNRHPCRPISSAMASSGPHRMRVSTAHNADDPKQCARHSHANPERRCVSLKPTCNPLCRQDFAGECADVSTYGGWPSRLRTGYDRGPPMSTDRPICTVQPRPA